MLRVKQSSKRKSRSKVLPVLGAAGISLAMAGSAAANAPAANVPSQDTGARILLAEEEISDVSLATFYLFDKENAAQPGQRLAGGCGRGGLPPWVGPCSACGGGCGKCWQYFSTGGWVKIC